MAPPEETKVRAGLVAVARVVLKENARALFHEGVAARAVDQAAARMIESMVLLARTT